MGASSCERSELSRIYTELLKEKVRLMAGGDATFTVVVSVLKQLLFNVCEGSSGQEERGHLFLTFGPLAKNLAKILYRLLLDL